MTNLWVHQSQNKSLFNPFLARKKRCKYLVSPGVTLIPGFMESLLSQVQHNSQYCHSSSKWSWVLSHQPGQAAEISLIQLLCRPSLHHTKVSLLEHKSSSLIPKMSMGKPGQCWKHSKQNGGKDQMIQKSASSCKAQSPLSA